MDIIEAIKERRSVRSFNGESLSSDVVNRLVEDVKNSTDPFGGKVTIRLKQFDLKDGYKPSTYGMIKGTTDFFLLGIGSDEASALSAGFRFERVVLKAWEAGLGTCWIAATFKGSDFDRNETWPDGEELKIICPVGVAAKQSLLEKMTRLTLGSKNRKPFDTLFFTDDFKQPLSQKSHFGEALEMLRLAPSATNSQPWRALVAGDTVHFYYKPKSAVSILDCGIGMCHFYLTEEYQGRNGRFFKADSAVTPPEDWKYLYSFKEE
ncbi:MAG: nitroreductase [Bacteroides sp.]|nr:nitroreductase [Bacteroides sp.]